MGLYLAGKISVSMRIDLNCDLGEGYPNDAGLMPLISSANIACGEHAGDEDTMRRCIDLALESGVALGAHPGFSDKENFGRLPVLLTPEEYTDLIVRQLDRIQTIATAAGARLHHVKPHGALYNMAAQDPELAGLIARAVLAFDPSLILYGLSGSVSIVQARAAGLRTASEVFADRTYQPNGQLTPRSMPNALIEDPDQCRQQVLDMVQLGCVRAVDGSVVPIAAETICLHGDGNHATAFARSIRQFLEEQSIAVAAP